MEYPQAYKNLSDKAREFVIHLGLDVFKHYGFDRLEEEELIMRYNTNNVDGQMDTYKETIDRLKKDRESRDNYHTEREEELRKQYESKLQTKGTQIETLKNEIITCENSCSDKIRNECENKHKERINEMKELHSLEFNRINIENKILRTELVPLLELTEKKSFNNSTEQGNYGENLLQEVVNHGLPFDTPVKIEQTQRKKGSGDRILRFDNGFVLMVEVKNENTITQRDIEQFKEHSNVDFKEKKCDCALFLSLRTPNIPGVKKAVILRYDNNMVYCGLGNNLPLPTKLAQISEYIHQIFEKYKEKKGIKDEMLPHGDISIYDLYLITLNNQCVEYESIIKKYNKELNEYKEKLSTVITQRNQITRECARNKNIKYDPKNLDEKIYEEEFIVSIKKWKKENNIIFKNTFKREIETSMELNELEKKILKKIKLTDIQ